MRCEWQGTFKTTAGDCVGGWEILKQHSHIHFCLRRAVHLFAGLPFLFGLHNFYIIIVIVVQGWTLLAPSLAHSPLSPIHNFNSIPSCRVSLLCGIFFVCTYVRKSGRRIYVYVLGYLGVVCVRSTQAQAARWVRAQESVRRFPRRITLIWFLLISGSHLLVFRFLFLSVLYHIGVVHVWMVARVSVIFEHISHFVSVGFRLIEKKWSSTLRSSELILIYLVFLELFSYQQTLQRHEILIHVSRLRLFLEPVRRVCDLRFK